MRVRSALRSLYAFCLLGLFPAGTLFSDQETEPKFPTAEPADVDIAKLIAQRAALRDLTGDDPYVLREAGWTGNIAPGDAKIIQVQLFRRNAYKFWFAVPGRNSDLNLNIYNGDGVLLEKEMERYDEPNVVALSITPENTGVYYVRVSLKTNSKSAQDWSLIYAYR